MNRTVYRKFLLLTPVIGLVLSARPALACAACFGQSDSPLAAGMNWGILALLLVVGTVLSGFASFGVFLVRRAAAVAAAEAASAQPAEAADKV